MQPGPRASDRNRIGVALLLVTSLLAAAPACATVGGNVDALSAVEPDELGLPVLSLRWKFLVADHGRERKPQEFASAAVGSGVGGDLFLYVGSSKGTFYALSGKRAEVLWKTQLGSTSSRPVVYLGRIYLGTDDGEVICLDTFDGEERWRYTSRGPVLQSPVLADEMLFFSNEADQVYALDQETGKFLWQYRAETPEEYTIRGHAGVAVDDGLVFTGFANGTMVGLRATTGSVAWMTSLKGDADRFVDVDGTPVVHGDTVYVTSSAGGLYALDKTTGLVRWRVPIENAGALVVDGDMLFVTAAEQGVYALDLAGNVIWRQGTRGGGEPAAPIVSGDYLIYSLSDAGVFVADKRTGEVHQYFDPGEGVSSEPTLWRDRMFVLSNGGFLYALNLHRYE